MERTLIFATKKDSTKEKVLRLIDILFDSPAAPDIPLEAVADEAQRLAELGGKEVSDKTIAQRRQAVARFIRWSQGNWVNLAGARAVDKQCALAYAQHLKREGLSPKSIWNMLSILSATWNLLQRGHDNIVNPWQYVRPISHNAQRGNAFTREEVQRIFVAADSIGHDWGLACRIAAATGLRYGDVANLKHEDLEGDRLVIKPSKTRAHGIEVFIPLPKDILEMIPHRARGYIMPAQAQIYARNYRRGSSFKDVLQLAGIDENKYTFHSFRHYFRTRLAAAGVPNDIAMKLGGWTQPKTAERYNHEDYQAQLRQAIESAWRQ